MISQTPTPKEIKNKFLTNNLKYNEIQDKSEALANFYSVNSDEDVWIMQCPKGTSISFLKEQQIKLPGRSTHEELETVAIEYPEPVDHAFGHKNKKAHNSVKIVPVRGSIVLRSRLKAVPPPDASESQISSKNVPMPKGIKERHPLHGVDYERKLLISPQATERLKQVIEVTSHSKKLKKKSKNKSNGETYIAMDSDGDVELVIQKKQKKKKKRKHSNGDEDEVATKKKEKRNSHSEDVAEHLQWIQKL